MILSGGALAVWMRSYGGAELIHDELGPLAALLIVPVMAVVAVSPFPSELIALLTCTFYGFWGGTLLAWCGWLLAALLQYELARRTASDFDFEPPSSPGGLEERRERHDLTSHREEPAHAHQEGDRTQVRDARDVDGGACWWLPAPWDLLVRWVFGLPVWVE